MQLFLVLMFFFLFFFFVFGHLPNEEEYPKGGGEGMEECCLVSLIFKYRRSQALLGDVGWVNGMHPARHRSHPSAAGREPSISCSFDFDLDRTTSLSLSLSLSLFLCLNK